MWHCVFLFFLYNHIIPSALPNLILGQNRVWPTLTATLDQDFYSFIVTVQFGINLEQSPPWNRRLHSDQPGVAEVLDEDLVDEVVLRQRLDHHHPLGPQLPQDVWDVQGLKRTNNQICVWERETKKINTICGHITWKKVAWSDFNFFNGEWGRYLIML